MATVRASLSLLIIARRPPCCLFEDRCNAWSKADFRDWSAVMSAVLPAMILGGKIGAEEDGTEVVAAVWMFVTQDQENNTRHIGYILVNTKPEQSPVYLGYTPDEAESDAS